MHFQNDKMSVINIIGSKFILLFRCLILLNILSVRTNLKEILRNEVGHSVQTIDMSSLCFFLCHDNVPNVVKERSIMFLNESHKVRQ